MRTPLLLFLTSCLAHEAPRSASTPRPSAAADSPPALATPPAPPAPATASGPCDTLEITRDTQISIEATAGAGAMFALEPRARAALVALRSACREGRLPPPTRVHRIGPYGPSGPVPVVVQFGPALHARATLRVKDGAVDAADLALASFEDWLRHHPEVDLAETFARYDRWQLTRVRTPTASELCLLDQRRELVPAPVCWSDPRRLEHVFPIQQPHRDATEEPLPLLAQGPVDARAEILEIDVPHGTSRVVGTMPFASDERPSPSWTGLARSVRVDGPIPSSTAPFAPLPTTPPPEWASWLRLTDIRRLPVQGAEAALAITVEDGLRLCLRTRAADWRCTAGPWPDEGAYELTPIRMAKLNEFDWVVELEQHQTGFSTDLEYEDRAILALVRDVPAQPRNQPGQGMLVGAADELALGRNRRIRSFDGAEALHVTMNYTYHDWQIVQEDVDLRLAVSEKIELTYPPPASDDVEQSPPRRRRTRTSPHGADQVAGCWLLESMEWSSLGPRPCGAPRPPLLLGD